MQRQQMKCATASIILRDDLIIFDLDLEDSIPPPRHDAVAQREIQACWS